MENTEKRRFDRCQMRIRAIAQSGRGENTVQREVVWLRDLSGEGALFITARIASYPPGQRVTLSICMPGAPGVQGVMSTCGTVIRVEPVSAKTDPSPETACIALHFLKPLQFQRNFEEDSQADCTQSAERE